MCLPRQSQLFLCHPARARGALINLASNLTKMYLSGNKVKIASNHQMVFARMNEIWPPSVMGKQERKCRTYLEEEK